MTALVTGGSGVVGRALVHTLLDEGERVRVFDARPPPYRHRSLEYVPGDIRDPRQVSNAAKGCAVAFHLAAKIPQARLSAEDFRAVNVQGTVNVADGCLEHGVGRLVFASTTELYGPQKVERPFDEEAPKLFTGPYSRNTFECEQLLARYLEERGLESASLRMPMVMGPGFYHEKAILALLWMVRHHLPVPLPDPEMLLSFVSSEDAARAMVLAGRKKEAAGGVFNIAALDHPKLGPFFREFVRAAGSRSQVVEFPGPVFQAGVRLAKGLSDLGSRGSFATPSELIDFALTGGAYSIERARRVLGYACLQAWLGLYRWFFGLPAAERADIFFRRRAT